MPVRALPVNKFKLLAHNTGWVSTGNRLLLTTDNGTHWKDISPTVPALADPNNEKFSGVFFLDAQTGWLLYATVTDDTTPDGQPIDYYTHLFATIDGGASWTTVSQLPILSSSGEVTGGGFLVFSDKLHGWVDLGTLRSGILFATSDGGRTWQSPKSQPGVGSDMVAPTDKDLWMAGGRDYILVATHDGANTFQEVSLPVPAGIDPDDYPTYGLPVFRDSLNGYESVMYTGGNGDKSAMVLFATTDGGRTWKPDRILSNLDESSAGGRSFSAIAGSDWIFSYAPDGSQTTLAKIHPNEKKTATTNKNGHDGYNDCELSFLTADEGWMNCLGILSSTIDSGASWTAITPRVRNGVLTTDPITPVPAPKPMKTIQIKPATGKGGAAAIHPLASPPNHIPYVSGIDQHLGFDSTNVLSVSDMQTWWNTSPYYDVGIYLPDTSPGKHNRHNDKRLLGQKGGNWVDAVIGQGWGIIPIWFGLQAPCANDTFHSYISADANKAANQGVAQADLAYDSATSLGLDGSIVYFDIEPYSNTSKQCSAAVSAYVGAFVNEMHEKAGGSAGVYGNVDAAPGDLYNASPRPDDIWIANNSGRVTVWNLTARDLKNPKNFDSALTDNMWENHQRMHQYRIDTTAIPVIERWGGVPTIQHTFDDDLVDATVVQSSGVKQYKFQAAVPSGPSVAIMGGIANGINDGTTMHMGPVVGFDYNAWNGFVDSSYSSGNWPYPARVYPLPSPPGGLCANVDDCDGPSMTQLAINNLGQIVGSYYDASYIQNLDAGLVGVKHGFLYTPGAKQPWTILDVRPDANAEEIWNWPISINDAGWVIGTYMEQLDEPPDPPQRCVLWKPPYKTPYIFDSFGGVADCGAWYQFSSFGSTWVQPQINGLGQIAGTAVSGGAVDDWGQATGAVFLDDVENGNPGPSDNVTIVAPPPSNTIFSVYGLNNNGQIAGMTLDASHGWDITSSFFINTDGTMDSLATPDENSGCECGITGLNDDVQMVGESWYVGYTIDTPH
jgi:photosystem II stability/assembly factor-like uncharacterized protein